MKPIYFNKMNTTENNKLIAEFMGLVYSNEEYYFPIFNSGEWFSKDELLYHTDWNWLMPVVAKITQDARFIDQEERETLIDVVPYGIMEDVYYFVVQFIKWYNEQNPKP